MYIDPYEKFIHKPVKKVAPPTPIVPAERVKRPKPELVVVNRSIKLTSEKVKAMRLLRAQGVTTTTIAHRFSVSESTARRAVKGQAWKNV